MHRFPRTGSALLIVDVQERLAAQMRPEKLERLLNRTSAAIQGAKSLGWPILVTEQYPKGLGPTLRVLAEQIPDFQPVEKIAFSALVPQVKERLAGCSSVLVTGMETHICVFQTVRDLTFDRISAYVAADAVTSRAREDEHIGFELCRLSGGITTTVETALFDALGKAGSPEFKAISAAVK